MRRQDVHHAHRLTVAGVVVPVVLLLAVVTSCSSSPRVKAKATLVASTTRIDPGDSVMLSGAFSARKAGLDVRLESNAGTGTTFTATGDAAATDSSGSYTLNYRPDQPGQVSVRIQVTDGTKKTASTPIRLVVLAATIVTARLTGAAEIGVGRRTTMTGHVMPAVPGRVVDVESSVDGAQWSATSSTSTTDGSGKFKIAVPLEPAGPVQLRIVAATTSMQTSGTSTAVHLYIADYKGAGAKYLACVKDSSAKVNAQSNAGDAYDSGSVVLAELERADAALGVAYKRQITCLKSYGWPPSVAQLIKNMQAQLAVSADTESQLSHATTIDDYNRIAAAPQNAAANTTAGADAAKIRKALGLPARAATAAARPRTVPKAPVAPPTAPPSSAHPPPATSSAPTDGPHLVRGYLVTGWAACREEAAGSTWVHYGSILDVYGPTAHHRWLVEVPGYGSVGPDSSRAIPGGVEYVFGKPTGESNFTVELYGPSHRPVTLPGQNVIDSSASPPTYEYTPLAYENGGVVGSTKYCGTG